MAVAKAVVSAIAGLLVLAAFATPVAAVNRPLDPPAGANFDTTDRYDFAVEHDFDDPPWAIVLSPGDGTSGGMIFPSDDPDYYGVDMGWLAVKFNVLGRFTWSICDYDEAAMEIVAATCSPSRPFFIAFRLSTLTASAASSDARRVFKKMTRFELPRSGVRCRRDSRTKRTCRVSEYFGDSVIYGRVVLWSKRPPGVRTYDLTRYRATLRIYDEYCHLVNKRPFSECDDPYKKRSGWTYQV
jgi:hypothetical protein